MTDNIPGPVPVMVIFWLDLSTTPTLTRLLLKVVARLSGMLSCLYSRRSVRLPPVRGPTSTYTMFLSTETLKLGGTSVCSLPYRLGLGKTATPLVMFLGMLRKPAHRKVRAP